MKRNFFPCALNLKDRPCLVVGNDKEAVERAKSLVKAEARVTLIGSPLLESDLHDLEEIRVRVQHRLFKPADLEGFFLVVFCIKSNPALTRAVAEICRKNRALLCAIDQPAFCDVVNVSVFERGPLHLAIGTNGISPGLSRRIRLGLEDSLKDVPLEDFMDRLRKLRERVEREIKSGDKRREALLNALNGFEFSAKIRLPERWKEIG